MLRVLHIENDEADILILKRYLIQSAVQHEFFSAETISEADRLNNTERFDVIFCDYNLPDGTATDFIENKVEVLETPVIILSSKVEVKHAVESLKKGAFDFIAKEFLNADEIAKLLANVERRNKENKLRSDLEKRLDENYANTRAFLDNTTDGIWSVDSNGVLLMINHVAKNNIKQQTGRAPKIGEPFFEQIPKEFAKNWLPLYENAINGRNTRSINEYSFDREFVLESSCTPIISNDGISGATFFAREVTERIQQEKKLRENEQNFRSIFENSDVPIMLESRIDNSIIDLNDACARLHKYRGDKMIGMSIFDTIPPDHLELSQRNYKLYLQGKIDVLDSFVFTSDKQSIPVQISVAEIEFNGIPTNLIFFQDISQRKETERKLQEAKHLAEKSAEFKSQFLANMSHEIRTPLNALVGFADILEKSNLDADQLKLVKIIQNSSEDLMSIINDILDLTKIEAGKMTLHPRDFRVEKLINKVEQLYSHKAHQKGIQLNVNIATEARQLMTGDEVKISQILNNLVSNAIKFTEKGKVDLNVLCEKINQNETLYTFEVSDTGIGISKEDASTIFQNFTQVDSSFQRQQQGTGLGLSIVKNLCQLMDGNIQFIPKEGAGSLFRVQLPLRISESHEEHSEEAEKAINLENLKVLICEDHEVNILLNERVMQSLNVRHAAARNGKEGLEFLKTFEPDLILMDLQMPIMDGYTAAAKIRESSDIPIYAMSAHVLDEERKRCLDLGMNGFISKPFKIDDLKTVFGQVAEQKEEVNNGLSLKDLNMPTLLAIADGDAEFIKSLFNIYIQSTENEVKNMVISLNKNEISSIQKSAHKMKPSFITFEFNQLNEMADKIESDLASKNEIEDFIKDVQTSVKKIKLKQDRFNL